MNTCDCGVEFGGPELICDACFDVEVGDFASRAGYHVNTELRKHRGDAEGRRSVEYVRVAGFGTLAPHPDDIAALLTPELRLWLWRRWRESGAL